MSNRAALPLISTPRLILRLLSSPDAAGAIAYFKENKEHLGQFSPLWPLDFFTEAYWKKQIDKNIQEFQCDQSARFFLFEKDRGNRIIGNVSFNGILRSAAQFCYLGYGIAQDKQGQGYMSEAVAAALRYVFEEMNIHRVMANYVPTNERSGKLLKRLGFVVEGYARDYLNLNGKWQDHILTSIVNPDWKLR